MAMGIVWFVLLGSLYLFFAVILYRTSPVLSSLILFIGFVHLFTRGIRPAVSRMLLVRETRKAVASLIRGHLPVLASRRGHLVKKDAYGIVHYEEWEAEKEYFISTVLGERFAGILSEDFPLTPGRIDDMIERGIDGFAFTVYGGEPAAEPPDDSREASPPHSCREYCVRLLELAGWKVLPEDEGSPADVPFVAERAGTRLVVSCSGDPSPVGFGPVRRTARARRRLDARQAAVAASAGFSWTGRLASSWYGVMALALEDLANL